MPKTPPVTTLRVYLYERQWVFDDPEHGLVKEPFYEDAGKIIDWCLRAIRRYPEAMAHGFDLQFSDQPFDGHAHVLMFLAEKDGGSIYFHPASGNEGWLCPALAHYFTPPPRRLYFTVSL